MSITIPIEVIYAIGAVAGFALLLSAAIGLYMIWQFRNWKGF